MDVQPANPINATPAGERSESAETATNAKRSCVCFVALTCCSLLAVAVGNFVVNPHAQYPTRILEPVVQTSRLQKLQLLRSSNPEPEGLILGSSRVLKFEPDYLESKFGVRFFNAGVNYGKPEDALAFLRTYRAEFDCFPKVLVLGLDVNSFTDGSPPDARLLSIPALASQVPEVVHFGDRFHRWRELLSWQQTRSSLKSIAQHLKSSSKREPTESFRDDGLILYHQRSQQIAKGIYDFQAALEYNKNEYRHLIRDFQELSNPRCRSFETIAELCNESGCQLLVFLTPIHPELAAHLKAETEYVTRHQDVYAYLTAKADSLGFVLHDFSDVTAFRGDPEEFFDGIHPAEANTRLMADLLAADSASQQKPKNQSQHYISQPIRQPAAAPTTLKTDAL